MDLLARLVVRAFQVGFWLVLAAGVGCVGLMFYIDPFLVLVAALVGVLSLVVGIALSGLSCWAQRRVRYREISRHSARPQAPAPRARSGYHPVLHH